MTFSSIHWFKIKRAGVLVLFMALLTTYQILESPSELRHQFLYSLAAWHLGAIALVLFSANLMERHLFRNWFRCSFLRIAVGRITIFLLFSAAVAAAGMWYYRTLSPGFHGLLYFSKFFIFYSL